ncbi:MAG: BamA/TamA family outer membrane protein [Candidatus Latescibacterota bacterium]|jgi:outer membrane protein assembly factor BamA
MLSARPYRPVVCLLFTLAVMSAAAVPAGAGDDRALRLETIEINGNTHTQNDIVLRHLGLEPGDAVTAEGLERARRRLLATDYFTAVDLYTRPGSGRGDVVLVVDLEERGFPTFETGFGFHDLYGWFLTLGGLRFDNLWGTESQLRVGVRLGWRLGGVDAEWRQSLSGDGFYGLGSRLYVYNTDQRFWAPVDSDDGQSPPAPGPGGEDDWREFQQQIARAGGEISFDVGRRASARFSFGVRAESIDPDSTFNDRESNFEFDYQDLPEPQQGAAGDATQTGLFVRVVHDTRNTPVYPSSGNFARLWLVSNNTWMGGDQTFAKAVLDVRKYFHFRDSAVLAARLSGGLTSNNTPYYDRFYIGGIYSIRGFAQLSLSAPGGDDGYWLANLDWRWRMAGGTPKRPRVVALVFLDAGQGYRRDSSFDYEDINVGAGYGVRFRLPWVGTLGLDVGIPLTEPRTGNPFWFHGALDFSF